MNRRKKYYKNIVSFLLVISLLSMQIFPLNEFTMKTVCAQSVSQKNIWTGDVADGFAAGSGTEVDPYIISNAEELAYFAKTVNSGKSFVGKYLELSEDIYLNDISDYDNWSDTNSPPNVWEGINDFAGSINGQGHTICGLYMCNNGDKTGFINSIKRISDEAGTSKINSAKIIIKNLNFEKVYIQGASYVGALVGYADSFLEIDKCRVQGKILGSSDHVGGYVGHFSSGGNRGFSITNSANYALVSGRSYVGGFVGYGWQGNSCGYSTCGNGNEKIVLNHCINYGMVKAKKNYVGGIGGLVFRSMNCDGVELNKLGNEGDILGINYVGGIFGCLQGSYYAISLNESYNSGNISGSKLVGGIVGLAESGTLASRAIMQNFYNTGNISAISHVGGIFGEGSYVTVLYSCNFGKIVGESQFASLIGRTGYSHLYGCMGIVKYSYYLLSSSTLGTAGSATDVMGYFQKQMKDEENYIGFDFNKVWKMGVNSPIFLWQIGEEYVTDDTKIDNYMIEQVNKYTCDDIYHQFDLIINSDMSEELKFKRLNDFFSSNGLVDAKEGIQYLSNTTSYRNSYRYLTNNEIYCAHNFWEWLFSDSGTLARGLLYADGLIYNGEIFDYADISIYAESDYPGVKKNKAMLKEFIACCTSKSEVFANANKTAKFFTNILKLNNIVETAEMENLMDQILACESEEELHELQMKFVNKFILPQGKHKIYLSGDPFAEALSYASNFLSLAGATADDLLGILNISNEIETYIKYKKFLTTIYQCKDVSFEMRLAAYSLLDEIENGYMNKLKSILLNSFEMVNGIMEIDTTVFNKLVGEGGEIFLEALSTIKLATFISNIIVDTGDFVKQVAYTQGYAELSALYSLKLQEDKEKFRSVQSSSNAWEFFEDYTMLWALRYEGEKQYLEMNKLKMFLFADIKTFNYDMKENVVKETISQLSTKKFEIADEYTVPESILYRKKAVINCPVDVNVYKKDGTLVAELLDGIENDTTNEYGRFAVVYQPYSGEYAKVLCLSTDEELTIKASAISDGLVDWQIAINEDGECLLYSFDKQQVKKGDVIEVTGGIDNTYVIYKNGKEETKKTYNFVIQESKEYVPVSNLQLKLNSKILNIGDLAVVGISVLPSNATNKDVVWRSSNEDVVTIKNGLLTAIGVGEAIIYVNAIESDDICEKILVKVQNKPEKVESTHQPTPSNTQIPSVAKPTSASIGIAENQKPEKSPNLSKPVPTSGSDTIVSQKPEKSPNLSKPVPTSGSDTIVSQKPEKSPNITSKPVLSAGSDTIVSHKVPEKSSTTYNPKPFIEPNTVYELQSGDIVKDNQNNILYKVLALDKTVEFYKVINKKVTKVVIPNAVSIKGINYKVTAISDNAFNRCKKLKTITLGKDIVTIGNKAFFKCSSLKKIVIPANVVGIGRKAFYGCKRLKTIIIKTKKLKNNSVGTQSFKGIYKKAFIKVPKKQRKVYKKWLKKKSVIKTMKII